jgi:hypothetical protein
MKMEQIEYFETSAYKIQKPGNYPEKTYNIQNTAKVWNKKFSKCNVLTFMELAG